jgi:hypothetical protein
MSLEEEVEDENSRIEAEKVQARLVAYRCAAITALVKYPCDDPDRLAEVVECWAHVILKHEQMPDSEAMTRPAKKAGS